MDSAAPSNDNATHFSRYARSAFRRFQVTRAIGRCNCSFLVTRVRFYGNPPTDVILKFTIQFSTEHDYLIGTAVTTVNFLTSGQDGFKPEVAAHYPTGLTDRSSPVEITQDRDREPEVSVEGGGVAGGALSGVGSRRTARGTLDHSWSFSSNRAPDDSAGNRAVNWLLKTTVPSGFAINLNRPYCAAAVLDQFSTTGFRIQVQPKVAPLKARDKFRLWFVSKPTPETSHVFQPPENAISNATFREIVSSLDNELFVANQSHAARGESY
jgi:hypothetical protein